MIAVLQRVSRAGVTVDEKLISSCGRGFLILLGVERDDDEEDCRLLADKISRLRVFSDDAGKMNLSVNDVSGEIIVVSNFTLLASYRKGNRPDFTRSAPPSEAQRLYDRFCDHLSSLTPSVGRGIFGADMKVELLNDGPVTICMDSKVLRKK